MPAQPVALPPDPDYGAPELNAEQAAAADASPPGGGRRRLFGHAPRRRHRLGQDRGLFRGGGRGGEGRPAGADPAAGDRAHRRFPRPLRPPLRHAPGGMALGGGAARPRAGVARGRRRRGAGGGRRPLGPVPAVRRPRPHRRRRGARPRLQAGGARLLLRPRHGGGARPPRRLPGGAVLGDAVDRIARQRRCRALQRASCSPTATRRRRCPRSRRSTCATTSRRTAASCRRRWSRRWARRCEQNEQALLFLNRRGYAPLTLCRTCGHRFQCPNCSTWLVEHRFRGVLLCHHCGHSERRPEACPACGDTESLVPIGPGVERLAEEVAARFPDARTIVLSSDLSGGVDRLRLRAGLDRQGRGRHRHRHPARRQGPQFPASSSWSAWSTPISAWRMAISAPPSAPSSSSAR